MAALIRETITAFWKPQESQNRIECSTLTSDGYAVSHPRDVENYTCCLIQFSWASLAKVRLFFKCSSYFECSFRPTYNIDHNQPISFRICPLRHIYNTFILVPHP